MAPKRRYFSYLRERWWVVLICASAALAGILSYETVKPETYISYAQLYTSGEVQLNVASLFNEESQTYYGTQIELLKSARLESAAFARIGYVPKPGEKDPVVLEVVQPMKTSILLLKATGSDPNLTQRFLQALIDSYLEYKKATRRSSSDDIVLSLTDQVVGKEKELKLEQENWTQFQRTNNVAVLDEEGKSAGMYLADLNLELAKLKLNRELLVKGLGPVIAGHDSTSPEDGNSPSNETNGPASSVKALNIPLQDESTVAAAGEVALNSAKVELALLHAQRDQVYGEHGEAAARRFDDAVTNMEQRVVVLQKQADDEQALRLNQLEDRITVMEKSIPTWEERVLKINELLAESQRLKNNIQREQGFYDHLLATLQTADLGRDIQQETLAVLQTATPASAVSRHFVLRIVLGILFGGVFGMGIVFCWYLLDDRFVSVQDVKDQFGEPVLGLIPRIKMNRSKPEEALLRLPDSRVAYAESYRHLRSALLLSSSEDKRPQTLLLTSAVPSEGKTTVAINVARVLANSGFRVVLVDADPHQGNAHRLLGFENERGVLDFLRGAAELNSIIHTSGTNAFEFVPVGNTGEGFDGLFLRPRFDELLNELRVRYDFVILDSAPILASDDAVFLASRADIALMVVRSFFSRSRLVRQSLEMLSQRQVKELAIVFNGARAEDLAGNYAQYGTSQRGKNGSPVRV